MTNGAEASTPSTNLLRRLTAERVLQEVWDGEPVTASALMAATGLARSTVLTLCRTLTDRGWLTELDDARAAGLRVLELEVAGPVEVTVSRA